MIKDYSIGAIVIHDDSFLLLKYKSGHWGFVKGHKENGEKDEETILRELKEETGINKAKIIPGFEDSMQYYFKLHGDLVQKKVKIFLIEAHENDVQLSNEHEDFIWLPYKKALRRATFKNARILIMNARIFLKNTLKSYI